MADKQRKPGKNEQLGKLEDDLTKNSRGTVNVSLHLFDRVRGTYPLQYSGSLDFSLSSEGETADYIFTFQDQKGNGMPFTRICISIPRPLDWQGRFTNDRLDIYLEADAVNFGPNMKIRIRPYG